MQFTLNAVIKFACITGIRDYVNKNNVYVFTNQSVKNKLLKISD